MHLFRLLILHSQFSHILRILLISFEIILGATSILAIRMTNQAALQAIERMFRDTSGKSDLMITNADTANSGFPFSLLRRVTNFPGMLVLRSVALVCRRDRKYSDKLDVVSARPPRKMIRSTPAF